MYFPLPMRYAKTSKSRRIVGRFDSGERLPDAIIALCRAAQVDAGRIQAQGLLKQVDLGIFSRDSLQYTSAFASDGSFELLSLTGNISMLGPECVVNAHAVVGFSSHGETRIVGGQLRTATVVTVEFVVDTFDDLVLQRSLDAETGLPLWSRLETAEEPGGDQGPPERDVPRPKEAAATAERADKPSPPPTRTERPASPPGPPASKSEWQAAAMRAQGALTRPPERPDPFDDDDDDEDNELDEGIELVPGDILLHPRLGECDVVRVEDDVAAYIRLPKTRRISKLALGLVRLEHAGDRDGKRLIQVNAAKD